MNEPNFIIGFTLYGLLIISSATWFYFNVIKESPVARATRILNNASIAFTNKNLVALKFQLKILGEPKIKGDKVTQDIILILIETLESSGTAKVK